MGRGQVLVTSTGGPGSGQYQYPQDVHVDVWQGPAFLSRYINYRQSLWAAAQSIPGTATDRPTRVPGGTATLPQVPLDKCSKTTNDSIRSALCMLNCFTHTCFFKLQSKRSKRTEMEFEVVFFVICCIFLLRHHSPFHCLICPMLLYSFLPHCQTHFSQGHLSEQN